jgi:hypothetical protein
VLNTSAYAGTTYFGYQDGNGKFIEFSIAYCPVIESLESEYFRQVLVHEAIGHGFGKLEDEYVYPEKGSVTTLEMQRIRIMQANGWAQNVDFTASADTVLWAPFLTDSHYQNEHLGVYEGACTYSEKRKICAVSFLTRNVGDVPDVPRRKPPLSKGGAERKRGGGIPGRLRV